RPLRVVVDSEGRIPLRARLLGPDLASGTLVAVTERASTETRERIAATGAEVALLPQREGRVDLDALVALLGERGLVSVLLEAGPTLLGAFFAGHLVDKVWAFVAPKVVGGNRAPAATWAGMAKMSEALGLERVRLEQLGEDFLVEGYLPEMRTSSAP
ncbi:MAG: RibD family protein, partial [Bacteroidetes bacterium]|nr:RibD family protein [Bacteroidota bacterium]